MSLRLYLDDSANHKRLLHILRGEAYGHDVQLPIDVGLRGAADAQHFEHARSQNRIILTKDPRDFTALHLLEPDHAGIFAIHEDGDSRDLSVTQIAGAIQNIVDAGVPIAGQFHVLNHWRY